MKRILLTGSSGFIGQALLQAFKEKYEVIVLDREKYPFDDKTKLVEVCHDIDIIVHVGGLTRGDSEQLLVANTLNTMRLAEAVKSSSNPIHFIFASSFSVYAGSQNLLTEESTLLPRNSYGLSKKWAEEYLKLVSLQSTLQVSILRIANVYGPHVPPFAQSVVSTFIEQIKNDMRVTLNGDGTQTRDFVFISDVVEAFSRAILKQKKSNFEVFNICSATSTSLNELISTVAQELHKTPEVEYKPSSSETVSWIGDFQYSKKALNWEPKITLEKGIKKCVLV